MKLVISYRPTQFQINQLSESNFTEILSPIFSANKHYIKIKLMQNETNLWGIFGKDEMLVKL